MADTGSAVSRLPHSLGDAVRCFQTLPAPAELPVGLFHAELYGPALFQRFARIGLAIGGLPRWQGKRFRADGSGINLIEDAAGATVERLAMQLSLATSPHDGRGVVRVGYDSSAHWPWPAVVDELRPFDDRHWLGMARTDWSLTRGLALLRLPFLLVRDDSGRQSE